MCAWTCARVVAYPLWACRDVATTSPRARWPCARVVVIAQRLWVRRRTIAMCALSCRRARVLCARGRCYAGVLYTRWSTVHTLEYCTHAGVLYTRGRRLAVS